MLGQGGPQFPFQQYLQSRQASLPGAVAGQALGGIDIPALLQIYQKQKAQSVLAKALEAMRNPQSQTANAGVDESNMTMPAQKQPDVMGSLLTLNPELGTKAIYDQLTPSSQWKIVPNMLSKAGKPLQENSRTGQIREAPFDVTPTGRGNAAFGTGSTTWETATPEEKNIAQALYEGRMRPGDLGYRDRSIGVKLAEQYGRQNKLPPYKSYAGNVAGKTAEQFASGKLGQNALSLNTALGHVDSAFDAYNQVANTDQAWLNRPLNALRKQTNDPNVVKLNVTLNALRGELGTVFKGSAGTDQDAKQWMDYLSDNLTPAQFNAAIPEIDKLLRSRLSALDYQRTSGMTGRGEAPILSPKGAAISTKLGKGSKGNFSSMSDEELKRIAAGGK